MLLSEYLDRTPGGYVRCSRSGGQWTATLHAADHTVRTSRTGFSLREVISALLCHSEPYPER